MFKIDQNFSDKIRAFLRYTQDADNQDFVPTLWSPANYATVKSRWTSPAISACFHLTQTIRPNLVNEFIFSYSADVNTVHNFTGFDSPAGSINKPAGFAMQTIFPGNQSQPKLPGIQFNGGVPFQTAESTGFEFDFCGSADRHQGQSDLVKGPSHVQDRILSARQSHQHHHQHRSEHAGLSVIRRLRSSPPETRSRTCIWAYRQLSGIRTASSAASSRVVPDRATGGSGISSPTSRTIGA